MGRLGSFLVAGLIPGAFFEVFPKRKEVFSLVQSESTVSELFSFPCWPFFGPVGPFFKMASKGDLTTGNLWEQMRNQSMVG